MRDRKWYKLSKYQQLSIIILGMMLGNAHINEANALTSGDVLEKLSQDERYSYVSGAIEGIAYSRFLRERPNERGMKCMLNWYYDGGVESWKIVKQWFRQHEDKTAEVVLYAILSKECGK